MSKRVAAIYGGSYQHHRGLSEPKYARHITDPIYILDLLATDLQPFAALLIPERLHQGRLVAAREQVLAYLEGGRTVVAFGEQPRTWLPGVQWEPRPTNFWWWLEDNPRSGLEMALPEHSLFRYVTLEDATWHQHGVLRAPAGAETPVQTADGAAVFYIDRVSSGGTLIVTTLDPLFHYGGHFMPATERFLDGFLPWLVEEIL